MTNTQLMDYIAQLEALLSDTIARVLVLEKQVFPDMQHPATTVAPKEVTPGVV